MRTFKCVMCGGTFPVGETGGTGYARRRNGEKICYSCCAIQDKQYMDSHGKMMLYLDSTPPDARVTNWPGTLRYPCQVRRGKHNLAGTRYDVWFKDHRGASWHGVQYGENTEICHCRRNK